MLELVAKKLFLTKGKGIHEDRLTSFEYALRDAGIAGTNIVLISSIFPPNAKLISRKEGLKQIKPGQILFTIYSKNQTNEPHRVCAASVGIAQPKNKTKYGYLSEYESFGQNEIQAGDYAEDVAAQMLASSLGIPFDVDKAWNEKRQQWSISGQIYKELEKISDTAWFGESSITKSIPQDVLGQIEKTAASIGFTLEEVLQLMDENAYITELRSKMK